MSRAGHGGVLTLQSRLDAIAALDARLGFDPESKDSFHRVSAEFTSGGSVHTIFAFDRRGLIERLDGESRKNAVLRFVAENASMWDLQGVLEQLEDGAGAVLPEPEELTYHGENGRSEVLLTYRQSWRGLRLIDDPLVAHFVDGETLSILSGHLINQAGAYFDPVAAVSEEDAQWIALDDAEARNRQALTATSVGLVGHAGKRRLLYWFRISTVSGASVCETWVDAQSGEVVQVTEQSGEYGPTITDYKVFHPQLGDIDQKVFAPGNIVMAGATFSAFDPANNNYYPFDVGDPTWRSPIKIYNGQTPKVGGKVVWDVDVNNVWDQGPASAGAGWRKFNESHVSYWSQIFRYVVDSAMASVPPPVGYGVGMKQVVIVGCDTGLDGMPDGVAVTKWGCNFSNRPGYPNYTNQLFTPSDETGSPCTCMPIIGQTRGQSPVGANNGTSEVGWLWHELAHGVDRRYGASVHRPSGESVDLDEVIANLIREVVVGYHFSTSYNFNDFNTGDNLLTFQVGGAGTTVDTSVGTRKCYPILTMLESNFGHPIYQAVWESIRGRHCHPGACADLGDGATALDAVKALFFAVKYYPSDGTGTLPLMASYFLNYYLFYVSYTSFHNRATIFDNHGLYDYSASVTCNGSQTP